MSRSSSQILSKGAAMAMVLAVLMGGTYLLVYTGPQQVVATAKDGGIDILNKGYDLVRRAGGDFARALQFQPVVVVGETTVLERTSQVTELVTATRLIEHTYTYEQSWLGSTKRLELKGEFLAKAGIPVDKTFALSISEDGQNVSIRHTPATVFACELVRVSVTKDESGLWNKLTAADREAAQNALLAGARNAARSSDLLAEATRNLSSRLAPLQEKHSFKVKDEVRP